MRTQRAPGATIHREPRAGARTRVAVPALAAAVLIIFSSTANVRAAIVEEPLRYMHNTVELEGVAVYEAAKENKRPAVVIFHDWRGPGEHEIALARRFAGEGYIAFVADLFGSNVRPKTTEQAASATREFYRDRDFFRRRAFRAFEAFLDEYWIADRSRVASIGTAFGGTAALELARVGARVTATVAITSSLAPAGEQDGRRIQGRVLVFHADSDPYVGEQELHRFIDEMRAGSVDYELVVYGAAERGFMDPNVPPNVRGTAYDPALHDHTWRIIDDFLERAFSREE
ncbi:MAG: hypothetical protein MAG453_01093 [Calditrichaeota bacterium]|nr:hypothetical protein [Calditrichota bacterium]